MSERDMSPVEGIKARSNLLRGSLRESLADGATGGLAEDDTQLSKFHGFYQQDDREIRAERTRQKLEPAIAFMIRVRLPGGIGTSDQWLAMDDIAGRYANGTLRLTTRQTFQLHGVIKRDLKPTIQAINAALMDTIAACGDVNRNVMCTSLPEQSSIHAAAYEAATAISAHLTPHTKAYHEIWLDRDKFAGGEDEPIYGKTYLPRKFKIGVAIPPANDVDIYSQDLGFIAIEKGGKLEGFNVAVGGGMGMSHGEPETYPRLASVIGFCAADQVTAVAEHVVRLQRDFGDRTNRKHARLKYTIDDRGLDWFSTELETRLGYALQSAAPFRFVSRGDHFGWLRGNDDQAHLTLFVPEGRVRDTDEHRLRTALREIATRRLANFRVTANQNLILSGVGDADVVTVDEILASHGVDALQAVTPLRAQALACVALPTCGLAMAEAERYLPRLTGRIEELLERYSLGNEPVSLRITGCPNGCARPYLAEIGLVGKAPGQYALFLAGNADGTRLNRLALENADEQTLLAELDGWFGKFAGERKGGESFGDFVHRELPETKEEG